MQVATSSYITENDFPEEREESLRSIFSPRKPQSFYIVFSTFIVATMVIGSIIFLAFLSTRKNWNVSNWFKIVILSESKQIPG